MISKMLNEVMRKSVKQNGEQDRPHLKLLVCHCVHIPNLSGLYLRVNPSALPSGVIDASS